MGLILVPFSSLLVILLLSLLLLLLLIIVFGCHFPLEQECLGTWVGSLFVGELVVPPVEEEVCWGFCMWPSSLVFGVEGGLAGE